MLRSPSFSFSKFQLHSLFQEELSFDECDCASSPFFPPSNFSHTFLISLERHPRHLSPNPSPFLSLSSLRLYNIFKLRRVAIWLYSATTASCSSSCMSVVISLSPTGETSLGAGITSPLKKAQKWDSACSLTWAWDNGCPSTNWRSRGRLGVRLPCNFCHRVRVVGDEADAVLDWDLLPLFPWDDDWEDEEVNASGVTVGQEVGSTLESCWCWSSTTSWLNSWSNFMASGPSM